MFDRCVNDVIAEYGGIDIMNHPRAVKKLICQCERREPDLTNDGTVSVDIDSLYLGENFPLTLELKELQEQVRPDKEVKKSGSLRKIAPGQCGSEIDRLWTCT